MLRAGRLAGERPAPFDRDQLVELMFGRAVTAPAYVSACGDRVVLQTHGLVVQSHMLELEPIDLEACAGEVIGLAGLEGSGQRLFMEACAGIRHPRHGALLLNGEDLVHAPYSRFLERNVAYVPASRLEEGLVERARSLNTLFGRPEAGLYGGLGCRAHTSERADRGV